MSIGPGRLGRAWLRVTLGLLLAGCAADHPPAPAPAPAPAPSASAAAQALAVDFARTRPPGPGARFALPPFGALVRSARPIGQLRCSVVATDAYGAHIELFADDHEVPVPAGIGWAPPQRRVGAVVKGGRCAYPLRTDDPTGVVRVDASALGDTPATLGELFRIWGQPLGRQRMAGFVAPPGRWVVAYVSGEVWRSDPRRIPLSRHTQIELELGTPVEPHPRYLFPPGL